MNRPSAVGHLYRFVTRSSLGDDAATKAIDVPSAVNKAALMRESALKSTIFVGVPRVSTGWDFGPSSAFSPCVEFAPLRFV